MIGIQARSDSERLPQKVHLRYREKSIIENIYDACSYAADYINRSKQLDTKCEVAVLTALNDPVAKLYRRHKILQGPKDDVLTRYVEAVKQGDYTHVVRITADCIHLPSHVVSRCIKSAIIKGKDYTTNISFGGVKRTSIEGYDTEVLSRELVLWLDNHATSASDREHVTPFINESIAIGDFPFSTCAVLDPLNLSEIKTSIDTQEDYERTLANLEYVEDSKEAAAKLGEYVI